jgi:hypothetical protein
MITDKQAERIVEAIESDILGRKGIGDELDGIDADIREEIREKWKQIILGTVDA